MAVLSDGSKQLVRQLAMALPRSGSTSRSQGLVFGVTRARQQASRLATARKAALEDPRMRAEARAAASAMALARKRARRVGIANASSDKQVIAQLRKAQRHASKATIAARHPRSRRRVARRTVIVTGAAGAGDNPPDTPPQPPYGENNPE
jgi:hypothetical protein